MHDELKKSAETSINEAVKKYKTKICDLIQKHTTDDIDAILEEETRNAKIKIMQSAIGVKTTFTMPKLPEIIVDKTRSLRIGGELIDHTHIVADTFAKLYEFTKQDNDRQRIFLTDNVIPEIMKLPKTRGEIEMCKHRLGNVNVNTDLDVWKAKRNVKIDWILTQENPKNDLELAKFVRSMFLTLPLQMYPTLVATVEDVSTEI